MNHQRLPETADKPIDLLTTALKKATPVIYIHGWAKDRFWGDKIVENRVIGHISVESEDLAKLRWSEIFEPLEKMGCTDFNAALTLYDAQGVWAGYDLTSRPEDLGKQFEAGKIDATDLPIKRRTITIGFSLPA